MNIAGYVSDVVNPNGIKTVLTSGLSTFPIKDNLVLSSRSKSVPRNPHDFPILCNWVFYNFILAEELFAKPSRSFETRVLVNNNLGGKSFSSLESPTTFDKLLQYLFFIPNFNS